MSDPQVDRLSARWYAAEGDGVPWVVIQAEGEDGHGMHHAIAECGTRASAEMIARALNNSQGAVALLTEVRKRSGRPFGGHAPYDLAKRIERFLDDGVYEPHPDAGGQ